MLKLSQTLVASLVMMVAIGACQSQQADTSQQAAVEHRADAAEAHAIQLEVVSQTAFTDAQLEVAQQVAQSANGHGVQVRAMQEGSSEHRLELLITGTTVDAQALAQQLRAASTSFAATKIKATNLDALDQGDVDPELHDALQNQDPAVAAKQAEAVLRARGEHAKVEVHSENGGRRVEVRVEKP